MSCSIIRTISVISIVSITRIISIITLGIILIGCTTIIMSEVN